MEYRAFKAPKQNEAPGTNEDSLAVKTLSSDELLVTMSDGASTGVFSRAWSEHLTANLEPDWVRNRGAFAAGLSKLRAGFKPNTKRPTALRKFLMEGSYATLMASRITRKGWFFPRFQVNTMAVGDVVQFVVHNGVLVRAFPYQSSEDFGNNPQLIRSNEKLQAKTPIEIKTFIGRFDAKHLFLYVTDALGEFILRMHDQNKGRKVIKMITRAGDEKRFSRMVVLLRKYCKMRNDDVAVVMVQNDGAGYFKGAE